MKKRILLVEDNQDHAELITETILENPASVEKEITLIKDGREAIDYFKKTASNGNGGIISNIELIILDLSLPKVDGMEVLKFIKSTPRYRSIPVVILSTISDHKTIAEAYDNGADSYIVKPISYEKFARKIAAMEEYWLIKYVGSTSFSESL